MVAFEYENAAQFDIAAFQKLVERDLPAYAQPVFIRIQATTETTATFKLVKGRLRKEAYHLDEVGDDVIFVRKPRSKGYDRLDREYYEALCRGEGGF
jgi:citronellyl-CoA synthetase